MAAVALENVVTRLKRAQQVEAGDAAARAAHHALGDAIDKRRSVVRLSELAGHQPDDAARPVFAAADQGVLA